MDTSALVAALVADHEHHAPARHLHRADEPMSAIVLAETFAQLRRTFGQSARAAESLLHPWTGDTERVLQTSTAAVVTVFARAAELDLGGSIHDALIAQVCVEHGVQLVTLDARQHQLALAIGASSTYLLAEGVGRKPAGNALRPVEAGESVPIRRGREPVAMLVRAPREPGRREIWGDLDGSIGPEFDALPEGFEGYA